MAYENELIGCDPNTPARAEGPAINTPHEIKMLQQHEYLPAGPAFDVPIVEVVVDSEEPIIAPVSDGLIANGESVGSTGEVKVEGAPEPATTTTLGAGLVFQPAAPGDTPGELVPGEGDTAPDPDANA